MRVQCCRIPTSPARRSQPARSHHAPQFGERRGEFVVGQVLARVGEPDRVEAVVRVGQVQHGTDARLQRTGQPPLRDPSLHQRHVLRREIERGETALRSDQFR